MKNQGPFIRYSMVVIVGIISGVIFLGLLVGAAKLGELLIIHS